jgi:hypothetical protein
MGKCLAKRGLEREEPYIETQNDTRKGKARIMGNCFRETRLRERTFIYSDTE